MSGPLVICDNLVKIYKVADLEVVALQGLDLEVNQGEMISIVGASGSGKSTLLNILSGLDVPSAGQCIVDGNDLTRLGQSQRINYRRFIVGQVWQQSGRNLLPELSAQANKPDLAVSNTYSTLMPWAALLPITFSSHGPRDLRHGPLRTGG